MTEAIYHYFYNTTTTTAINIMKYTFYKHTFFLTLVGVITLYTQETPIPISALQLAVTDVAAENITAECQACLIRLETATPTTVETGKTATLKFAKRKTTSDTDGKDCCCIDDEEEDDTDADELNPQEQARQEEISQLERETELLDAQTGKFTSENNLLEQLIRREQLRIDLKQVVKPKYLTAPFVHGKLFISDRRIDLNGEINTATADLITKSIHFYNNEDTTYPIFLVINESPGGTLAAGAHIIEVMQHSQAPVYVVVKREVASMAAIIVALAPRSFAYPNALITYHQPARIFFLEMVDQTQMEESSQRLKEWSKRLLEPVAKKMGLTLEEFIKKMYEHNSTGEWAEFATEAQRLKWVDFVVSDIRETSFTAKPTDESENLGAKLRIITEESQAKAGRRMKEVQSEKK
jgi:ATP-dependent protease ClpP protease subunit